MQHAFKQALVSACAASLRTSLGLVTSSLQLSAFWWDGLADSSLSRLCLLHSSQDRSFEATLMLKESTALPSGTRQPYALLTIFRLLFGTSYHVAHVSSITSGACCE